MIRNTFFMLLTVGLLSCGGGKSIPYSSPASTGIGSHETAPARKALRNRAKATAIVSTALSFSGTPYQYGGSTRGGMDCSGLIYSAFRENGIAVPRTAYDLAKQGKKINVKNLKKGDLLYFKTGKSKKRINHAGLVVEVRGKEIKFIHSTTSRGVLISSLREGYWNEAFVKAMRIL